MADVFEYKVAGPEDFSAKLIEHNSLCKENQSSMVAMQVILKSGHKMEGFPVNITSEGNSKYLLLCSETNPSPTKPHSLNFVEMGNIEAVGVFDAHMLSDLLISGEVNVPIPKDQIPTRLELRKKIAKIMEGLSPKIILDPSMTKKIDDVNSDREKYFLGQFFEGLQQALQEVQKDDLGKKSLQKIKAINVTFANKMDLSKVTHELKIQFGTNQKIKNYKDYLKDKIESLL